MGIGSWLRKIKKDPKIAFNPGEFEVLKTRAERAWWERGLLIITNHRLFWFPAIPENAATVEIDLQKVLGCTETRSWYYFLAKPALRVLLTTGKSVDFHGIQDYDGVKRNIERFMGHDRYTPGTLFSKS
jgi:hypothetical protein